ncbi:MAG TPA: hypothetical protein VG454_05150 [Gemmatimonadales bacterium]|nr:hypothetical protein [Gemmatimonadales bacterium]
MTSIRTLVSFVVSVLAIAWAGAVAAQVVVGTGDPSIDVPAVQAAVDQGGNVILKGHLSFDATPTISPELPGFPAATVRVSKAVTISGGDGDDELTTIEGGQIPFLIEAPGSAVTIQRLRFVRPTRTAINVSAIGGLVIASCRIDGVQPLAHNSAGILINTRVGVPDPARPGQPERISGTLLIVDNDIDVAGGTALDDTIGVQVFNVGVPGAEVEAYVAGNKIRNVTEPAINIRRVVGRVYVERNMLRTAAVVGPSGTPFVEVIRVVNLGSYLIAQNSIDCRWPQAFGIGVFSQVADWPMEHAVVAGNDVRMSPPDGTIFGPNSAAISVRGFANGNLVFGNILRGSAGNAISVTPFPLPPAASGIPSRNTLLRNRLGDFVASGADFLIGAGVQDTLVIGEGSIEDHGVGTVVVPLR